jgi:hypothetical protein
MKKFIAVTVLLAAIVIYACNQTHTNLSSQAKIYNVLFIRR